MRQLEVLFIQNEWIRWKDSRFWSYGAHLALAEGLRGYGVRCTVTTADRLAHDTHALDGRRFDQIWFNDLVHIKRDDAWFRWLASLAPMRVGWVIESLTYSAAEILLNDELRTRKSDVGDRIQHMTHVVACDERDATEIDAGGSVRAMWSPFSVPEWAMEGNEPSRCLKAAVFLGSPYGGRRLWLNDEMLTSVLARPRSLEDSSVYPLFFDALQVLSMISPHAPMSAMNALYVGLLMHIRRKCYSLYLKTLASGCAVVNLPHFVKTYSARVVEGIAAERPVISWTIPDRPLNRSLFEDGREILLYSEENPGQLRAQIDRLLTDPAMARQIVERAGKKVRAFHTSEERVRQVLRWIECGDVPTYA